MANVQRVESGAVEVYFPEPLTQDRPLSRPTFMFAGVAVHCSVLPTTAEDVRIVVETTGDIEQEFQLNARDLATNSLQEWSWTVGDGPWAIGPGERLKVTFPNTDNKVITVWFSGYFL